MKVTVTKEISKVSKSELGNWMILEMIWNDLNDFVTFAHILYSKRREETRVKAFSSFRRPRNRVGLSPSPAPVERAGEPEEGLRRCR